MDELLGRKIPQSAQAEQAVIGSILIDPNCVPEVLEQLKADDFSLPEHPACLFSAFVPGPDVPAQTADALAALL